MRSKATMAALACAAVILVAGPLVLTLLREEDYASTATLRMTSNPVGDMLPEGFRLSTLDGPLAVRGVQRNVIREVDWPTEGDDLPDFVSVRKGSGADPPSYVLTARAPTVDEAHALATASAREVLAAAEAAARFFLGGEQAAIEKQLRDDDLAPARRLELARKRDRVQAVVSGQVSLYEPTATPATRPQERFADRLLGALPGSRPSRPNPLWAGLAGLALAVALVAWVLALSPRRGSAAPSARG